ncbi:MAG: tRNA (adenosine(37)-N6)-dimethylallyltransferase MiaA [Bacteroidales bacterium]|jgi:tRNA dimethylallyltransferase|nr:tRNA (adenosine(37)-N6)-dimethylallyltransferase MiaA [Bacteroidales bacterium]
MVEEIPLLCVVGPTASGKTHLAVRLANIVDGEILSADSRQVYKYMDIGTGKDLDEYLVDGKQIPYHLIDIVDAGYQYSVYEYQRDFMAAYQDVLNREKIPILCGGSGMYIDAVLGNYRLEHVPTNEQFRKDAENMTMEELKEMLKQNSTLHNTTDTTHRDRLLKAIEIALYYAENPPKEKEPIPHKLFYIDFDRPVLKGRIALRLHQRLKNGLIEEVEFLMQEGISGEDLSYYGMEYRFAVQYLNKEIDFKTMEIKLFHAIGRFAKRQKTWFNRMRSQGYQFIDIDGTLSDEQKLNRILLAMKQP